VLDPVAELTENGIGDVERILRHEIDADALRADQAHHLFDLLQQRRRRFVEQQVRLVEEEHQLRFVEIADFRQLLEQLGQQPEQEGRVQARRGHQLVAGEDVDHALAIVGLHQVGNVEHRLAEEDFAALLAQVQQPALDGTDRRRRDIAVLGREALGVLADVC
jgi:DNA-binding TFAR19-related protein (PDSD5 family)